MTVNEWIEQQDDPEKWRRIYALIMDRWRAASAADPTLTMREFFADFIEAVDAFLARKGRAM
jgi:hypothetical protein